MESKNVHEFMQQSLLLPRLMGMCPLTYDYRLSKIALVRASLTCAVLCILMIKTIYFILDLNYRWLLSKYLDFLELYLFLGAIILCFLLTLKGARHFRDVVDSLESVDYSLMKLNYVIVYNNRQCIFHESARILIFLMAVAEQFILPLEALSWWRNLAYMLAINIAFLILHFFLTPFFAFLEAFSSHIIAFRKVLDGLKINTEDWMCKTEVIVHLNIQLYHASCTLSTMYSTVAFIVVSVAFAAVVKNIYFTFYVMIEYANLQRKLWYHVAESITFVAQWLVELCTVAYSCAKLSSQSMSFNDEVYEALLSDRSNLLQFSGKVKLQLAYKPVPIFKACGFLPLDFTLVQRMAGTATTYIVLLMQWGSGNGFKKTD